MRKRAGEYAWKGDYHKHLNPHWPYLPVYLEKMTLVRRFLDACNSQDVIYDMGCGEGVLVNEYREAGYSISGFDLNYSAEFIHQRNFLESGLADNSVDVIVCLDVIEHMNFSDQERAVDEFFRILRPGGKALITVPNLAHFASRLSFLVTGKLLRTSTIERHPGDRPAAEFSAIFRRRFRLVWRKGLFPTFPLLSILTVKYPARVIGLHSIYDRLFAVPDWCFLNAFLLEKEQ